MAQSTKRGVKLRGGKNGRETDKKKDTRLLEEKIHGVRQKPMKGGVGKKRR